MKVYDKIIENINEEFIAAKVEGTGKLAPRQGYYFIRKITYKPVGVNGEVPMASVNWKAKTENHFVQEALFEIAFSSLSSYHPDETATMSFEDLIEKVIYIHQPVFVKKIVDGAEKSVINCTWYLVREEPVFLIRNDIRLLGFGDAVTFKEAYQYLIANAGYDVLEALEYEAQFGYTDDIDYGNDIQCDAPDADLSDDIDPKLD
ncbi:MAG TPA: hypothetical protein VK668_10360 [Mucilaginibacter sp.]|nr:hypothetical protein [Mucilaginibacter sp.]